ncbi:MAG: AraC family transcriptional regulator, partial [Sphingobacteriaceae bacterium]
YIEKPFSPAHLKAQVASLLLNRKMLRQNFVTMPGAEIGMIANSKTDDLFLKKLNEVILSNIANTDLDVEKLADWMNMSRRNMFRKIKSVSGLSPAEMINIMRLKKAAEMLSKKDVRIYEVAMHVGFKSRGHFTRNFTKQFGVSPKEYAEKV